MTPPHELQEQIEKLDLQLLRLLRDRMHLCADLAGQNEQITDQETALFWVEEAIDQGMDEEIIEKMAKLVSSLCRKSEE
ncbi:MAG: chorismate mutase [Candidatus Peribacteraceae bacterium]|nr:chorismate mutase [Candidatus Peribacteraceae bacterium]